MKPKAKSPQLNRTNARALKLALERRAFQRVVAFVMNEWQRRYIEEPEQFENEMQIAEAFAAEEKRGEIPSYGLVGARYMVQLLADLTTSKRAPKQSLKTGKKKAPRRKAKQG